MSDPRSAFNWQGHASIFTTSPGFRKPPSKTEEQVLRVNPESNIGFSTSEDAVKTAKLIGRPNGARTQ